MRVPISKFIWLLIGCGFLIGFFESSAFAKFQMTKAGGSRRHVPKVAVKEILILDSQIQALSTLQDSDTKVVGQNSGARANSSPVCRIETKAAETMLLSKRQLLTQKVSDFVAPKIHAQGTIAIAEAAWPAECAKSCHCAVYKLILETAGAERLSEFDRRIYQSLTELAMNQPLADRARCASEGMREICHESH